MAATSSLFIEIGPGRAPRIAADAAGRDIHLVFLARSRLWHVCGRGGGVTRPVPLPAPPLPVAEAPLGEAAIARDGAGVVHVAAAAWDAGRRCSQAWYWRYDPAARGWAEPTLIGHGRGALAVVGLIPRGRLIHLVLHGARRSRPSLVHHWVSADGGRHWLLCRPARAYAVAVTGAPGRLHGLFRVRPDGRAGPLRPAHAVWDGQWGEPAPIDGAGSLEGAMHPLSRGGRLAFLTAERLGRRRVVRYYQCGHDRTWRAETLPAERRGPLALAWHAQMRRAVAVCERCAYARIGTEQGWLPLGPYFPAPVDEVAAASGRIVHLALTAFGTVFYSAIGTAIDGPLCRGH